MTLVELMIGMALGLFLLLGLTNIYLAQRQAYRTNENLSNLQNSSRVAFELMAREIRESGVNPCGARVVGNVLVNSTSSPWYDWDLGGIVGYDGDVTAPVTTGTGTAERIDGTDAVMIRSGSLYSSATIVNQSSTTGAIELNTTEHGYSDGDILMACDYKQAVIFQATDIAGSLIGHATGGSSPGNCINETADKCSGGSAHIFQKNGFVTPLSVTLWYVGNNDRGGRSLFRIVNNGTPQEIAEGVTDMQLEYLLRTGTGPASDYVDASAVEDSWVNAWRNVPEESVSAVRVELDLESNEAIGTEGAALEREIIHVVSRRGYREI